MDSVEDRVKECIVEMLGVDGDKISDETTIQGDLGADSLDVVEIAMELEEEFDINIPDDVLEGLSSNTTFGQVVAFIREKQ